jgi:EmrB/QacA subfamily drug resistance transporter
LNASIEAERPALTGTTIAALMLACAQAPLGSTMIAVALPSIGHALGRELALVTSLLVTSYLIVNIVGQSPGGKLGDVLGHGRALKLGMILQAAGALVGLCASDLGLLVVSRCAMALGGAMVVPATMALLRTHVATDRRGRVFGLVGATMSLSAAIGPPLGGELVSLFGWRAIFFVSLPCLAVAAVLARISPLPRTQMQQHTSAREFVRRFDWLGSLLLAIGLAALVVGSKAEGGARVLAVAACAATITVFVIWELRSKSPVLDPRLFRERPFAAGSTIVALSNFSMYGLIFSLPQFFQQARGATPSEVGRVLFLMMAATFLTSPIGGRLNDRIGARMTALAGLLPMLVSMLWLRHMTSMQVPLDAARPLVLLGIGIGLSSAPAQSSAMSSVSIERSGMAAGATSTMRYLGGVLSVLMLGTLLGGARGAADLAGQQTAGTAFAVAAALATVMCLALPGRLSKREVPA